MSSRKTIPTIAVQLMKETKADVTHNLTFPPSNGLATAMKWMLQRRP
jgi:hypothetical protein